MSPAWGQCREGAILATLFRAVKSPLPGFSFGQQIIKPRRELGQTKVPFRRKFVRGRTLAANALDGDLERCLAAGMNDYIAKPIHPDQLFSTMARYLVDVPVRVSLAGTPAGTDGMVGNRPLRFDDRGGCEMLLVRLMRIPEIDVPQAVSRMMGRQDLYVQLACRISAERADMVEKLREAYPGSRLQVWRAVHRMMQRPILPPGEDSELRRNFPQYVRALAEVYGVLNKL